MEGEERAERRTCRPTSPVEPSRRTVRAEEVDLVAIAMFARLRLRVRNGCEEEGEEGKWMGRKGGDEITRPPLEFETRLKWTHIFSLSQYCVSCQAIRNINSSMPLQNAINLRQNRKKSKAKNNIGAFQQTVSTSFKPTSVQQKGKNQQVHRILKPMVR